MIKLLFFAEYKEFSKKKDVNDGYDTSFVKPIKRDTHSWELEPEELPSLGEDGASAKFNQWLKVTYLKFGEINLESML